VLLRVQRVCKPIHVAVALNNDAMALGKHPKLQPKRKQRKQRKQMKYLPR
jgi:hypothetical protein